MQCHCKTCRLLRELDELDNQGTVSVIVGGHPQLVVELVFCARGKEPLLRTRELIVSRTVQGKAPKTKLLSTPIAVSGKMPTPEIKSTH